MQPSHSQLVSLMATCFSIAATSKAKRRACGACLVRFDSNGVPRIVSSGVNGTPPGTDNECEPSCVSYTYDHVIHAEDNCLTRSGVEVRESDWLFCTDSPCPSCLENHIDKHGIKHVVYCRDYHVKEHMANYPHITFVGVDEVDVRNYITNAVYRMGAVYRNIGGTSA